MRETGRLAGVNYVRCRSWIVVGEEIGWIDLEPVRAGELQHMCDKERSLLDKLDTPDGLLKTVLSNAQRMLSSNARRALGYCRL